MEGIAIIIACAVLTEGLVEYGKSIEAMFSDGDMKTGITQMITVVIGILLAFAFNADLFTFVGLPVNHTIGMVITGVLMSRGSNYVSDFIGKLGAKSVG